MIVEYRGRRPRIAASAFVAPTAVIIGDVEVEEGASVWYGAVLRGDFGRIEIRAGANIQDNAVIHTEEGRSTVIGENVTIGHGAVLEGCMVGPGAVVGICSVVLNGAEIGAESLVAAGSVVAEGMKVPSRYLVAGTPASIKKELSGRALDWVEHAATGYQQLARTYLDQGLEDPALEAMPVASGER